MVGLYKMSINGIKRVVGVDNVNGYDILIMVLKIFYVSI